MRLFLLALALVIAVLGCSDGKFNLLLVYWGDHDDPSSSSVERLEYSSNIIATGPSSSSLRMSSSLLSSGEIPSSDSRGPRYSSSKTDSLGYTYEDYPTLEVGAPGVKKGITTRYWDGCRPSCAYINNIDNKSPNWAIGRACAKDGTSEIPLLYLHPRSDQWGTYYKDVPCAKESDDNWPKSQTYKDWVSEHPDFPKESHAYTCFDMAPFAVNDTLAYAFAATLETTLPCGKCARLQFNSEWMYDKKGDSASKPRVTHRALKGKTLIVMANNTGTVAENHFDIMIPGGGLGAFDCFSEQIGYPKSESDQETGHILGLRMGGLLSECSYNLAQAEYGVPSDRFTLAQWQDCLEKRCHRAFDGKPKYLLDGCLWHVEWFMAADNPEVEWVETPCPKYLIDKYNSTATTKLPECYVNGTCQIDGVQKY